MDICYAYDASKFDRPVLFVIVDEHLKAEWWLAAPSAECAVEYARQFAKIAFGGDIEVSRNKSYALEFILQREINEDEEPQIMSEKYTKFGFERGR